MIGSDTQALQEQYPAYFEEVRRHYRHNFLLILIDSSIFSFVFSLISQDTIVPYFVDSLTGLRWLAGLVPAVFYLGYLMPQLFGAFIVHSRPKRKWLILRIAITQRLGILVIALVTQFLGLLTPGVALGLFFIAYLMFSAFDGLIIPGYSDFISKSIVVNRGLFFGLMNGLGGLTGFAASRLAQHWLDAYTFPENTRLIFWTALAVSTISPFFIANFKEVPFPAERKLQPLRDFFRSIPKYMRARPGFRRFLLTRAFLSLGIMGNAFYALYAIDRFDLSPGVIAQFNMVILLTQSLAGFAWGWYGDRFGYRQIYVAGSALVVMMGLLSALSSVPWFFYLVAFGMGCIYAVFSVADSNMVYDLAPPEETSRYIGLTNTFIAPMMVVTPLIGALIVDVFGNQTLFWSIVGIGLLSSTLTLVVMPRTRHKKEK